MRKKTKMSQIKLKKIPKKIKLKNLEDEAAINFILQHSKKIDIDFGKIKIPPFLYCLKKYSAPKKKSVFTSHSSDLKLPIESFITLTKFSESKNE